MTTHGNRHISDRINAEDRKELPDNIFGLPERREYPMPDAAHVQAAEAYFRSCPDERKSTLAKAILSKAEEYGVEIKSPVIQRYAEKY